MKQDRMTITEKILEILQAGAESTVYLIDVFTSGYYESYRKAKRGPRQFKTDWAFEYRQSQQFYSILNQLKNQGLVAKEKDGKASLWKITKEGLKKLKRIKTQKYLNPKVARYVGRPENKIKIVAFDIPEKERRKRVWLRTVLTSLGFSLLQQSVWIGKTKIPEEFIHDLRKLEMLHYVHIFEVSQKGTLHKIA